MNGERVACGIHGTPLTIDTVDGVLVESCVKCQRRAARICIDCGQVRTSPQAPRCETCRRAHIYAMANAKRRRPCRWCGMMIEGTKRQYCNDDHARLAKLKRARARYTERRQYHSDRGKRYRNTAAGMRSDHRSKRKGRLDGTWGYKTRQGFLDAMTAQNAKPQRAQERRDWARDNQSAYYDHGKKLYPHCSTCGGRIAWNRRGRPKKYHDQCDPHKRGR